MKGRKTGGNAPEPAVTVDGEVVRQIRQHARSCSKTEVCGVLIGSEDKNSLSIEACIAGANAAQAGTHVTFTQDTWEHIYKTKDAKYPDHRIVGWYHSHPGFGVFLSDHDTFIHKNFFSSPLLVAWVYDPHSDEEGCFGWVGKRLERLSEIAVIDKKGGEEAGETGKPEPLGAAEDAEEIDEESGNPEEDSAPWVGVVVSVLSYALALAIGFLAAWLLMPRDVLVYDHASGLVYDLRTGKMMEMPPGTHVAPDGRLVVPGINAKPGEDATKPPSSDGGAKPNSSDPGAASPSKSESGKEKNAPR